MRLYETAFLIAPNLAEDETEQLIQQMAEIVTEKKGEMVDIDKWGKRKMAYQIRKFDAATYVFFHYHGEADIPAELERRFKQTEAILRYLTVRMEEEPKIRRRKKGRPKPREAMAERKAPPSRPEATPEPQVESGPAAPAESEPAPEPVKVDEKATVKEAPEEEN
jgi:small subunit ribosomal protein S6